VKSDIESRLAVIEARNKRVESDKAWETSWTRRLSIMLLTYFVVVVYMQFVLHIDPWINALVPVMGFLFSTLTLTYLKERWFSKNKQ